MRNPSIFAASAALAAALAFTPGAARAQAAPLAGAVAAPIITRVYQAIKSHAKPEGSEWLRAEVIHADAVTLIVREQQNGMAIHTFNFSSELQPRMQALLDKGGFQYGDKVSILFMPGQTVALRIHGRPSKPL